jgi:hypothetical protein
LRVLLDESIPRGVRSLLPGHSVSTVQECGWTSKDDGELLGLASDEFDVIVTADQSLPYQQNLEKFAIGVVVLVAHSNRIESYVPLQANLEAAILNSLAGASQKVESAG